MRLLLDTSILIFLARRELARVSPAISLATISPENTVYASAASLWEISIKTRLGKLDPVLALADLAGYFECIGLNLLVVDHRHAVAEVDPEPATRDPFDRLLLAQCVVEQLLLVTIDRALAEHRLAWRPG